jgi:prepilin-type N-terminal cleavage/methylation domain-containing protein
MSVLYPATRAFTPLEKLIKGIRSHSNTYMHAKRYSLTGFTLIETLVAIAVITIAIVGPFNIVQNVLVISYTGRDTLIASALAQEGIEYVRQVRDSNYVYSLHNSTARAWLLGLDGTSGPNCYTNACVIDTAYQTVTSCGDSTCASRPLYLSNTTPSWYTQSSSGATVTKFTRKVRLTSLSATETRVDVTVSWTSHGPHSVTLTEYLRDWL